jgi:hypothetical protein
MPKAKISTDCDKFSFFCSVRIASTKAAEAAPAPQPTSTIQIRGLCLSQFSSRRETISFPKMRAALK